MKTPGTEIMGLSKGAWGVLVAMAVTAALAYGSILTNGTDIEELQQVETGQTQAIQGLQVDMGILTNEVKKNQEINSQGDASILRAIEALQ